MTWKTTYRPLVIALLFALLVLAHTAFGPAVASACPTCKDGLTESQANMARGYYWSILFMMSMPFLILGGLSAYFYWEIRRARTRIDLYQKGVNS